MLCKGMNHQLLEMAIMQVPVVVCFVWWAATERAKLYTAIDSAKDSLEDEIDDVENSLKDNFNQLDKRVDLHIQNSNNSRDSLSERISGQGKRFGSKFDRIERYMEKLIGDKLDNS